ncbi:MAG TPA: hypothetical protein VN618_11475 [Solirubrobacteraceae bacterium]|nr:hypothetical protein [Solirubrobacteraceae bacterium]
MRRNRLLALAILAILGLATVAPAGQASDATRAERQAERALKAAEHAAHREAVKIQREAAQRQRQEVKAGKQAQRHEKQLVREAVRHALLEDPHAVVEVECTRITVHFRAFNDVAESPNVIDQKVIFKQKPGPGPTYVTPLTSYSFEGGEATEEIPIVAPIGESSVVLRARFASNGIKGGFNVRAALTCPPIPRFALQTLQSISGPFTTGTIPGTVGETVTYESVATNTGNTPLTFTGFSDPGCDGAPMGGSTSVIAPRDTVSYVCMHALTNADRTAGFFADAASVTGTPEPGEGEAATLDSSGVLVAPIAAGAEKPKTEEESKKEVTTSSAPPAAASPKSGVLGFSSSAVPSLRGPAKCVRGPFTVSVKSAGVASVIFYLDGHKLARRTAHSAKGGLISIRVSGARLKAGAHRLTASITMVPGSPTAKAVVASRARTVRRCATAKHA